MGFFESRNRHTTIIPLGELQHGSFFEGNRYTVERGPPGVHQKVVPPNVAGVSPRDRMKGFMVMSKSSIAFTSCGGKVTRAGPDLNGWDISIDGFLVRKIGACIIFKVFPTSGFFRAFKIRSLMISKRKYTPQNKHGT